MVGNTKTRYEIDLATVERRAAAGAATVRSLAPSDRDALAQLMLDAYVGTIDYEGESLDEALSEVDSWLADSPLLEHSFAAVTDDELRSAILVMELHGEPFIAIVMTHPAVKRMGYGGMVARATLESLRDAGHRRVVFYITNGNTASESLFSGLGARPVDELP